MENTQNLDGNLKDSYGRRKVEKGFASKLRNRSKEIDEAVDAPSAVPAIEKKKDLGGLPKHEGMKWDDYLQKNVPENEWKSPQQHDDEEKGRKGASRGFVKIILG